MLDKFCSFLPPPHPRDSITRGMNSHWGSFFPPPHPRDSITRRMNSYWEILQASESSQCVCRLIYITQWLVCVYSFCSRSSCLLASATTYWTNLSLSSKTTNTNIHDYPSIINPHLGGSSMAINADVSHVTHVPPPPPLFLSHLLSPHTSFLQMLNVGLGVEFL